MQDKRFPDRPVADEEYTLPTVEALMAGTLALMTGYAQSADGSPQRPLMARKLVTNLFFLAEHPGVSPAMHCMLVRLRARWQLEAEQCAVRDVEGVPTPLWHQAPSHMQ